MSFLLVKLDYEVLSLFYVESLEQVSQLGASPSTALASCSFKSRQLH